MLQSTKGFEESIDSKFEVLEGKEYIVDVPADQLPSASAAPNVPLDLLEAGATPWPVPRRQACEFQHHESRRQCCSVPKISCSVNKAELPSGRPRAGQLRPPRMHAS